MNKEEKLLLEKVKENIPHEQKWSKYTAIILGFFVLLLISYMFDVVPSDYNVLFFILSLITGFYWVREKKVWQKYLLKNSENEWVRPWWLSWTAALFPIVVTLFLIRGFIAEPFKVPTGSMIPNIMIGDIILTNKIYYHVKVPVIEKTIIEFNNLKRNDVAVFRYPPQPYIYYVKRIIGIPGDKVEYLFNEKKLFINDVEQTQIKIANYSAGSSFIEEFDEKNENGNGYRIWKHVNKQIDVQKYKVNFKNEESCQYTEEKVTCMVPENNYFAIGDNRDDSLDSRFWGFVPKENIVGKAQYVLYSPTSMNRIGRIN